MRRCVTIFTVLVLALSGLVFSPAHAVTTYDAGTGNGTVDCSVSGYFIVWSFGITGASDCSGDAVIPAGVLGIENSAFYPAPDLVSVTIPASVNTIGSSAFRDAPQLVRFTFLGNAPSSVGANAFSWLGTSPKAVVTSDATGFGIEGVNWNGLTVAALTADGTYLCSTGAITTTETPTYTITDGVVSTGASCGGDVVLSDGVRSIEHHAFSGAGYITSITFTDDGMLTHIGEYAFEWLGQLKSIVIPASVATIGLAAFYGDSSLTSMFFLRDDPAAGVDIFWASQSGGYESATKAHFRTGATGFAQDINGKWNGVPISPFYILTFEGNGSESGSVPSPIFSGAGENVTIPDNTGGLTKAGYDFAGWTDGLGNPYPVGIPGPMPAFDGSLLAAWTPSNSNALADGTYSCSTGAPKSDTTNIYTITNAGSDVIFSTDSTCTGDVVIPEGVTTTSDYTFGGGSSQVTSVSLPESLNQIGFSAFYGTGLLTEINVASNNPAYTSVEGVLFGRDGINATLIAYPANRDSSTYTTPTTVSFPELIDAPVTSISSYAFQGAQKLTTLDISEGVAALGGGIAESTKLLSVINLPATYTAITGQPFQDAHRLTSITIKASVVTISNRAFINAYALSNIYFLGDQPTVDDNEAFIGVASGAKAYVKMDAAGFVLDETTGKWKGLTVVDLAPDGDYVCSTGSKTTAETPSLTPSYKITGGVVSDGSSCADTVLIPDGIKAIGNNAFEGATTLTSITIPAGVISIGDYAFFNTSELTSFTVAADNPNYTDTDGVLLNKTGTTLLLYPLGKTATSYLIPSGVTYIGNWAFYQETSLKSITIPEGVVTIGNHSFRNTSALTAITLPASLSSIGEYAFSFATSLTSIILPANVSTIGSNAFEYAVVLSSIYFLGDAPTAGTETFANIATPPKAYKKTENTTFTLIDSKWNGLTVSDFDYFANYESNGGTPVSAGGFTTGGTLSAPTLPTRSGYGFAGWSITDGGAAVTFPYAPELDVINDITLFANWLEDGNFFCSGDLAGERATDGATNIFTITDGVVSNGGTCTGAVVVPAGANSIGANAFKRSVMTSISLPSTLISIGEDAFSYITSLVALSIPEGVISIAEWAFSSSELLETINLPASVNNIGNTAFQDSLNLKNINVNAANADFASVNGVLFNKNLTTLEAYPAGKPAVSYTVPASVEIIDDRSFISARALKSVLFTADSQLTSLVGSVFQTSGLTSIILPAGVETIGSAFSSAQNLTSVTIPASVTDIGGYAFQWSTKLSSFYFLGEPPTVDPLTFTNIGPSSKAFVTASSITAFGGLGSNWNGLTVATINTYTLTYFYNSATGGKAVTSSSFTTGGTAIKLPTPTRTGYTFAGWYSDSSFLSKIGDAGADFSPTGTNLALNAFARWTPNKATATVKPKVSGTAKVGKTLTANKGTWTGSPTPKYSYQWFYCKTSVTAAKSTVPSNCAKISGATKNTFKLASAQKGKHVTVLVTGISAGTTKTSWLAKSTGKVK